MSPQQKRSQQYDWFKGPTAKGGPKDRKATGKKIWKFTKIFIYLTLFVFSMTGCIQSLIIKTTNYVGTGVEFYANREEVAPHVTRLDLTHVAPDASDPANAIYENYQLTTPTSNIWLNKDVKGAGSLKAVHEEIKGQSVSGDLRLEDAFKGSNEAVWLTKDMKGDFNNGGVTTTTSGSHPLVLSSLAEQSSLDSFGSADSNYFANVNYYTENGGTYAKKQIGSLVSFEDTKYVSAKKADLEKVVPSLTGTTVTALYTDAESKIAAELDAVLNDANSTASDKLKATSVAKSKYEAIEKVAAQYNKDLTRMDYTFAVLKEILGSTTTPTEVGKWLRTDSSVLATGAKTPSAKQIAEMTNKNVFIDNLLSKMRINWVDEKDVTKGLAFQAGQYPFFNSDSNWRPLVSWGDAWGEGPFYGLFVYPTAYVSANMIAAFPGGMQGWETLITIFVIVFSMRFFAFLLSFKATMQQTRMQELAAKKAIIDAKYAPYKGNKQMENRQRQEVSEMYKKQGVSPFGSMTSIFITMPLFLAIWRTIGALPHIKSTVWLGINFSETSWRKLFAGEFQYLPLMILAAGFAAFQQILPRLLTKRRDRTRINVQQKAAMKKGNKTQNIMMLVFVFMSLIFSAGLQVYWIAGGVWMTIQSTLTHFLIIRQSKNRKRNRIKT